MSNKKQKKDPNRIPKAYIVPPVSAGIKPNEVPTVNEDLFQLIVKYAERHPSDLRDKERNLAYYIRLHQMLQNSYTELLITHQKMLSYNQLIQQDRIDMLFLVPPHILPQRFPVIAEQNDLFYADAENGTASTPYSTGELTLPDKPDEFFYLFLPCFQKGVLQINEGRFNYFEIQELNLDTLTAEIQLTDYITTDGLIQIGRSVPFRFTGYPQADHSPSPNVREQLTSHIIQTDSKTFVDIYQEIPPVKTGWTRPMIKYWEAITLQNAVDQEYKFQQMHIDYGNQMSTTFLFLISIANYYLSKRKPTLVKPSKNTDGKLQDSNPATESGIDPIDPTEPIRRIRTVGTVRFISAKPPKPVNAKTVRQYHIAEWTVRGHTRTYANGKTVYIKPQVKRRKLLQNHTNQKPQNIIQFHDNRPSDKEDNRHE